MTSRLALGFNPVIPVKDAIAVGQKAEAMGYESLWFHESLYQRDVVTYLSSILLSTSRIKVASGVLNTFTRHPITVAATFASLSELSGGRAILGLGLGSFPTVPKIGYRIFPVSETRPLKRISEFIRIVNGFWGGESLSFKGEFFTAENVKYEGKLEHRVPLYLASLSPKTLAFAGRHADGAILSPALSTVKATERMVEQVRKGERRRGTPVDRVSYLLTSVDDDESKAKEVIRNFYFFLYQLSDVIKPEVLVEYGVQLEELERFRAAWKKGDSEGAKKLVPDAAIETLAIAGTPAQARARIEEYRRAGIDLPVLMPIGNVNYAIEALAPD
ncbi:MAG: LLM class flavin-dependent oxidoreductase [Thaumarchaeota archaeon]|nr:LLM class flavin-dependent oxidoreductase [Nitrososphaerota archaeon]